MHASFRLRAGDERTQAILKQIETSGEPASDEQLAELHAVQSGQVDPARLHLALLIIALLAMASARYWSF